MDEELTMIELIAKVQAWGRERGLDKTDPLKQYIKLVEEVSELGTAINTGGKAAQEDAIGDIMVVLTMICMQVDCGDIKSCLFRYLKEDLTTDSFADAIAFVSKYAELSNILENFLLCTIHIGDLGFTLLKPDVYFYGANFYIGRILSTLIKISNNLHIQSIDNCYRLAYEEIKDRKGKTIDGVFIKEADL